jgi:hypothetical protein
MHKTKLSLLIVLTLMCVSSAFALNVTNIKAYFPFDDATTSGTTSYGYGWYDGEFKNKFNGTITGSISTGQTSVLGQSYSYTGGGTGNTVKFPALYSIRNQTTKNWSISIWANYTSLGTRMFYSDYNTSIGSSSMYWFYVGTTIDADYLGLSKIATYSTTPTLNQWYHYVLTHNTTHVILYINGVKVYTNLYTTATTGNSGGIAHIGTQDGSGNEFAGRLDELILFKGAISDSEVSELYNSGLGCGFNCLLSATGNFTITATEAYTSTPLSSFSAVLENSTDIISLSTNTFSLITALFSNSSQIFNITVSKSGYISSTYTNYNISSNLPAVLYKDNSLQLTFLDEITDLNIYNVTFELISDSYSNRYNTSNNLTFNISGLVAGLYEIRYPIYRGNTTPIYDPRSYYVYVPITESSNTNLQLRMINETIGQLFLRNIKGSNGLPMTGYILDVQRFYVNVSPNAGTWRTVSQALIDEKGDAVFPAVANTQYYRFRILDNQTNVVYLLSKSLLVDSQSEFTVNLGGDSLSKYETAYGITKNLYWQNSTKAFIFDYSSNNLANICLYTSYSFGTNYTTFPASCSVTSAGTLTSVVGTAQGKFCANVVATISGSEYTIDTLCVDTTIQNAKATFGVFGFILLFFALVVCAVIGVYINPIVSVLTSVMVILLFSSNYFGFVSISGTIVTSIIIVGLFLLWLWGEQN